MSSGRSERRRSSELHLPPANKVQIGAHWKKPFSKIYDSTYGSHGRTYEDLLDPAVRRRGGGGSGDDQQQRRRNPPSAAQHRLSAVPERSGLMWGGAVPEEHAYPYPSMSLPREHVFKPLAVHRSTRSDEVLDIFGVPKVVVPSNYHDQELESFLQKIRSPRDPQLKLMQMERESRLMEDQALRRAHRMTAGTPEEAAAELYASANSMAQAVAAQF